MLDFNLNEPRFYRLARIGMNRGLNRECITEAFEKHLYIFLSIEILKQTTSRLNKTFDNLIKKIVTKIALYVFNQN